MLKRIIIFLFVALSGLLIAGVWYQSAFMMKIEGGQWFIESPLEIQNNNLVDLGVVDFDNDGNLDIFSVGHNSRQSLLKGDGKGGFVDVLSKVGLDQQPEFPAVEITAHPPKIQKPGFYIYWQNSGLVLRWIPGDEKYTPRGEIFLSATVAIDNRSGFDVDLQQVKQSTGLTKSTIKFTAHAKGEVQIHTPRSEIPLHFKFADGMPLHNIYIGQNFTNPSNTSFEIFLIDRHGMAWADYNSDGHMDVFIARGGLAGQMALFDQQFFDELLVMKPPAFMNIISATGMKKNSCPAYNVQWVDFNNDHRLDLYIACHHRHKNQLFRNNGDGTFTDVAPAQGLDLSNSLTDTPFVWLDADNDGRLDLIIATDDGVQLYRNTRKKFILQATYAIKSVLRMTVNDYDSDGDLDLFLVSNDGMNSLLIHEGPAFSTRDATTLGLPTRGLTASWVDYDNDGNPDLHIVPGGLFRQQADHTFRETGLLKHVFAGSIKRARTQWHDMDNDGDLDLVMGINYENLSWKFFLKKMLGTYTPAWAQPERNWEWQVRTYRNQSEKNAQPNPWLQVHVNGPSGNLQAIGASVALNHNDGKRVMAQVGQADDSLMSQGHYRLYFGLGESAGKATSLQVKWGPGDIREYPLTSVDRLVTISRIP